MKQSPLPLKYFRKKFPFNINYGMGDITIRGLLKHKEYELDFDVWLPTKNMNLQRPFVWTLFQKQEFILSKLKGVQVAPISVINYEHKIYRIVDGKQRLSTQISFVNGEFPILVNGDEYFYSDLDDSAEHELYYSSVKADIAYEYKAQPISDDDKIAWFEMINFAGTPQDSEHLNKLKQIKL